MHSEPLTATTGDPLERLTGARVPTDPAFSDKPLDVADTEVVGRMSNLGDAPGDSGDISYLGPLQHGQPENHNSNAIFPTFGPA